MESSDGLLQRQFAELLRRAVRAQREDTVRGRCAIYQKAREHFAEHLRGLNPPLPAREVARRRLLLESCIQKVDLEVSATPPAERWKGEVNSGHAA